MTVSEIYSKIKKTLLNSGNPDYSYEAKLILEFVLGKKDLLLSAESQVDETQAEQIEEIVKKRKNHYPLQYILGEWDFYKYTFKVGEGVLIPRSDTEILVEKAAQFLKDIENPQVLDLCAGSGCIGISIAKDYPQSFVTLVEKFDDALKYLHQNVKLNDAKNTKVLKGDIFCGDGTDKEYDLIVSNPPYIPPNEMNIISPETEYEPETALLGGEDGLKFYKEIIKNYKQSLKSGAMLGFEVGINEDAAVSELLKNAGFKQVTVTKDLNGIKRVVTAIK